MNNLNRMIEVEDQSQVIGEFLEWLSLQGITLAEYRKDDNFSVEILFPIYKSTDGLLAEYFGIDLEAAEMERRQLLDEFLAKQA